MSSYEIWNPYLQLLKVILKMCMLIRCLTAINDGYRIIYLNSKLVTVFNFIVLYYVYILFNCSSFHWIDFLQMCQ